MRFLFTGIHLWPRDCLLKQVLLVRNLSLVRKLTPSLPCPDDKMELPLRLPSCLNRELVKQGQLSS